MSSPFTVAERASPAVVELVPAPTAAARVRAPLDLRATDDAVDGAREVSRPPVSHVVGLAIGSLGFLAMAGSLGPFDASVEHSLGIAATSVCLALGWPRRPSRDARARSAWPGWLAAAAGFALLCAARAQLAWLFGAAAAVAGLSRVRAAREDRSPSALDALGAAFGAFAAVQLLVGASSAAYRVWNGASELLSRAIGGLFGVDLILGSSASGASLALLHLLLLAALGRLRSKQGRFRPWIALLPFAIHVAFLARAALALRSADAMEYRGQDVASAIVAPALAVRACIEFALLAVVARLGNGSPRSPAAPRRVRAVHLAAALALSAIAASTLWERGALASARPGRLLLCGVDRTEYAGFARWARSLGFEVRSTDRVADIDPPPGTGDVLALLFPAAPSSVDDARALLAAVESGAGLFVTADHTNALRCADRLSPVLEPLGMALRFDSAFPLAPWTSAGECGHHPVVAHWIQARAPRYLVGASLEAPWRGRVLVSGRYAFADRGDLGGLPENFLGDRRFRNGDGLGDLPLLVARSHGGGRVVVMGDTEALLDESLPFVQPCLEGVLAHLAAPARGLAAAELALGLGSAALAATLLLALGRRPLGWTAIAAALAVLPFGDDRLAPALFPDRPAEVEIHSIALANQARVSLDERSPRSIDRLIHELEERGGQAELVDRIDRAALARSRSLFLISPQSALGSAERAAALDLARRGGVIVVATDWQRSHAVAGLLDVAGIDVLPILAARGVDADPSARQRAEVFREPYVLRARPGAAVRELLRDDEGLLLAAEADVGRGRVVVIGDPLFLLGGNLGGERYAFGANIDLLHRIVEGP